MAAQPTAEDLEIVAALANELIRRIPSLETLSTLQRETTRVRSLGGQISFDLEDLVPLDAMERAYVEHALARCGGHKTQTADALGIDPSTLYRKLARWGI